MKKYRGEIPVYVFMEGENKTVIAHRELWVNTEQELLFEELGNILGKDNVKVS